MSLLIILTTKNSVNFLFIAGSSDSSQCKNSSNSDYSAMALKVLLLSDKRKKFASQIFSFVAPNSQPHVYWSVTGDSFKKALHRLIPPTRIKVSSFAVILLVLAHSYILCLPIVVYVQVLKRCTLESYLTSSLLVQACHAFPLELLCIPRQNWSLKYHSLSHFVTVFHSPLSCQFLQDKHQSLAAESEFNRAFVLNLKFFFLGF